MVRYKCFFDARETEALIGFVKASHRDSSLLISEYPDGRNLATSSAAMIFLKPFFWSSRTVPRSSLEIIFAKSLELYFPGSITTKGSAIFVIADTGPPTIFSSWTPIASRAADSR